MRPKFHTIGTQHVGKVSGYALYQQRDGEALAMDVCLVASMGML